MVPSAEGGLASASKEIMGNGKDVAIFPVTQRYFSAVIYSGLDNLSSPLLCCTTLDLLIAKDVLLLIDVGFSSCGYMKVSIQIPLVCAVPCVMVTG